MTPYVEPPLADSKTLPASLYLYDLFAVVTHEGKLDNGHYWADVLSEDEWWHCDDDKGELRYGHEWLIYSHSYGPERRFGPKGIHAFLRQAIARVHAARIQNSHRGIGGAKFDPIRS